MAEQQRERDIAEMEAQMAHDTDQYFEARPQIMRTRDKETTFEAGFKAAWAARPLSHAEGEAVDHWAVRNPGLADQFRAEAQTVRKRLGFEPDADDVSPNDLRERIAEIEGAPQVAVPEKVRELIGAVRSVNRSRQHSIHIEGDDEPCFWQRAEWVRYVLELADEAEQTITAAPTAPAGEPVVFPEPQEATTIEEYVGEYEYTDGEGHNYSPTETERALILDAIHGIPDHLLQPPKPAQQPVSDSDGSSNSSRALLDQIIEQLEGGFVACSSCGDQEDTATLDVMSDLLRLRFLLADAGNRATLGEREIAAKAIEQTTREYFSDESGPHNLHDYLLWRAKRLRAGKEGE